MVGQSSRKWQPFFLAWNDSSGSLSGGVEVFIQFTQDALVNPELPSPGIARFDRHGTLELVSDTFEDALDRTLVGLIVLARYKQHLARASWNRDVM